MNIQKVKEALQYGSKMGHLFDFDFRTFDEALAELENPVDDDVKELADALEGWNRAGWSFEHIAHDIVTGWGIRGFANAESYHAKKCAECIGRLPAFPHKIDKI